MHLIVLLWQPSIIVLLVQFIFYFDIKWVKFIYYVAPMLRGFCLLFKETWPFLRFNKNTASLVSVTQKALMTITTVHAIVYIYIFFVNAERSQVRRGVPLKKERLERWPSHAFKSHSDCYCGGKTCFELLTQCDKSYGKA